MAKPLCSPVSLPVGFFPCGYRPSEGRLQGFSCQSRSGGPCRSGILQRNGCAVSHVGCQLHWEVLHVCTRSIMLIVEVPNATDSCAYHPASSERNVSVCANTVSYPREHCLDVQFRIATLYLLLKKHIDVFYFLFVITRSYMLLCKDMCLYLSRLLAWGSIVQVCCLGLLHL